MPTTLTLHALLIDEIRDLLFAERLLVTALPKMAKAATDAALKKGFTSHLAQTNTHVSRLRQALRLLDQPVRAKTCHAMSGLVKEGAEAIELKGPPSVRDAALIGAAQRVEHYEIAGYGTAHAFAVALGENPVAALLQATLTEESATNQALTKISAEVNAAALAAGQSAPA